jgi:ornithine cyclodeaminase/alanine dehydrogenase-like protein (mu-crystallin family)
MQLDSVVSGNIKGRLTDEDVTLFESQGIALEDLAVSEFIYKRAIENNIGMQL